MKTRNLKLIPALFVLTAGGAFAADEAVATMGAGVALAPRYSGSDENMVVPVLALDYSMANGLYASTLRGLGYGGSAGPFSYSAALGYRAPRRYLLALPPKGSLPSSLRGAW